MKVTVLEHEKAAIVGLTAGGSRASHAALNLKRNIVFTAVDFVVITSRSCGLLLRERESTLRSRAITYGVSELVGLRDCGRRTAHKPIFIVNSGMIDLKSKSKCANTMQGHFGRTIRIVARIVYI